MLEFIFGGVFRLLPEFFRLWDADKQRQHERTMFDLQLKADELRGKLEMQKAELQGEIQQQLAELNAMIEALKAQQKPVTLTGNKFLDAIQILADAMSAFVRPTLTYWYCVAGYGAYKIATYYMILSTGASWSNAITVLWTTQDQAVMMSIIGFWFVDRAIRHQTKS